MNVRRRRTYVAEAVVSIQKAVTDVPVTLAMNSVQMGPLVWVSTIGTQAVKCSLVPLSGNNK